MTGDQPGGCQMGRPCCGILDKSKRSCGGALPASSVGNTETPGLEDEDPFVAVSRRYASNYMDKTLTLEARLSLFTTIDYDMFYLIAAQYLS